MQMNFGSATDGKTANLFVPIAIVLTSNIIVPTGVTNAVIVTNDTLHSSVRHSKTPN